MKILRTLLSCVAMLILFNSSASAATVTEDFFAENHINHHLPGYLVAGRVKISTNNDWKSISVGYSVTDQFYSMLTDTYIRVSNAGMTYGGDPFYEGYGRYRYIGRPESGDRYLTRWVRLNQWGVPSHSMDLFGNDGFTISIYQGVFGNEGWRVANIFISDRSNTSIDLFLWDSELIDTVPPVPPVPLPASGLVLLTAIGLLSVFRRKIV